MSKVKTPKIVEHKSMHKPIQKEVKNERILNKSNKQYLLPLALL